jgi:hypothetical protein
MVYNPNSGIYEPEQDPRQFCTGSMRYNPENGIWEPRRDDPNNMYGDNYMPHASKTMQYNSNTMNWEPKQQQQQQQPAPSSSNRRKK